MTAIVLIGLLVAFAWATRKPKRTMRERIRDREGL